MVIGVAGKYCSGKNLVANILKAHGFQLIDVDLVGHAVLEDEKTSIIDQFGDTILREDGTIDRKLLGSIVFADRKNRRVLEKMVHPIMIRRIQSQIRSTRKHVVINAAILLRMGLSELCDLVICVKSPIVIQMIRGLRRDRLPVVQIIQRILSQKRICPKSMGSLVDIYYVWNLSSECRLRRKIEGILEELEKKGLGKNTEWNGRRSYS